MAPTKDAKKLRRVAEKKGRAEDQYQVGCDFYFARKGVKQDLVAAAKWFRKAAAQEHARAQFRFGVCYYDGEGVEQNHELAVAWWEKAAGHGYVRAQSNLGCCYAIGEGVEQNDALAVAWWEKAARGGDDTAQYILGLAYTDGMRGLPKNAHCAKIFRMDAAKQGHEKAIEALKLLRSVLLQRRGRGAEPRAGGGVV
jgi:TPR repeat protein